MRNMLFGAASLLALAASPALALDHWKGSQKALVIMVEWSNLAPTHTAAEMRDTFFGTTSGTSLRSFFLENSAAKFDLTGEVLDWRRSTQSYSPDRGCDLDPIVAEGWRLFGNDVRIADYDSDRDGKIDNLFVIHSGRIAQDRVGPECTFTDFAKADHTTVFQVAGLGSIGEAIPIGFYVHESGHAYFNFPDLYGDHYHGRYGIAMWGMMGLGAWGSHNQTALAAMFRFPSHFEPLSKIAIGWVTPRIINTTTSRVVLRPVEGSGDIVVIPAGSGTNYYLEYRSQRGFSTNHRGHGLLIWKNYELVQADGRDDLNHGTSLGHRPLPPISENFGDASDPFPGSGDVVEFENRTAGFKISGIVQTDDQIEFDVSFRTDQRPLQYTEPAVAHFDGVERL